MSVGPVTVIPVTKQVKLSHTGGVDTISLVVSDSKYYTKFAFQVIGFEAAKTLVLEGSFNGTWSPLNATSFNIPTITTSASGMIFAIDTYAPIPGGLRITGPASALDGTILVQMTGNIGNMNR